MTLSKLFTGKHEGMGHWYDDAGDDGAYQITHHTELTPDGFKFSFHHIFDNGDPDIEAAFEAKWTQNGHFALKASGQLIGKGYLRDDFLHYAMAFGENIVESNWTARPDGLVIYGSATRNTAGNHISWREVLTAC